MRTMQENDRVEFWMLSHDVSPYIALGKLLNLNGRRNRCLCKAEFCYVCRVEWKNCTCPQWDEDRLIARRDQVVARAFGPLNLVQVQQIDEALRERHESWQKVNIGGFRCEECQNPQNLYIFECRQCYLRACHRCTQNRL